jgi:cob(I)alamin adenosyltransferase
MKIYTRTGDTGETALIGGGRVSKANPRVDAYGEVDELNAWIGVVRSAGLPRDFDAMLGEIQRELFALGAQLADPTGRTASRVEKAALGDHAVARLEGWIDRLEAELPPLTAFILPGGTATGAGLHVARAVCRRGERRIVAIEPRVDPAVIRYVNRLSDFLFVLARAANHRLGQPEYPW